MKGEVSTLIKDQIDEVITIHDFRVVKGNTHTNVIFDAVVPQQFKMTNKEVENKIKALVKNNFANCFAVVKVESTYI